MRLGGCNLTCRWCDTPYTWDWQGTSDAGIAYDPRTELHRRSVASVADQVSALGVDLVVISGGEPLGQQARLVPLVELLTGRGMEVEIETNGTHAPHRALVAAGVRFNVSPKLAHSGVHVDRRIKPAALRSLAGTPGTAFKFVCRDPADLDEVGDLVRRFGLGPVWIMPEGQSAEHVNERVQNLVAAVIERGWNLTTRLHILIWGQERGV
ncbi:7-carboxy-7-deazaguanine synthase QueE [Kitasatospora kifunensis]|uniref:7-carboxy-7-deazaguanine synthase n=1 Tax=Kitasatospora kifunensis TaxID=58351 RepID=A0A7W7R8Z2_KITKI|nr:7-carboxy-7-deazaguanine synthase QueE [Kitasatospora kifunensis]MBB4927647.1 organic radical activating enzyme [Kitasatospora kifunensis]